MDLLKGELTQVTNIFLRPFNSHVLLQLSMSMNDKENDNILQHLAYPTSFGEINILPWRSTVVPRKYSQVVGELDVERFHSKPVSTIHCRIILTEKVVICHEDYAETHTKIDIGPVLPTALSPRDSHANNGSSCTDPERMMPHDASRIVVPNNSNKIVNTALTGKEAVYISMGGILSQANLAVVGESSMRHGISGGQQDLCNQAHGLSIYTKKRKKGWRKARKSKPVKSNAQPESATGSNIEASVARHIPATRVGRTRRTAYRNRTSSI
jgi:hypothetical protein